MTQAHQSRLQQLQDKYMADLERVTQQKADEARAKALEDYKKELFTLQDALHNVCFFFPLRAQSEKKVPKRKKLRFAD